jgi:hypothetical protein
VLHPPPFFARLHGEGGREPWRASHAAPVLPDRSSTPPEGRNVGAPRWCLHRSTQRRRWPWNLRLFLRLLPFLFSCFPPCFVFPFASGREELLRGPELRECGTDPRSRRFIALRAAPPGRREQTRGFGSSAPSGVPPPWPGGVHCRGGGGVILAGAIIPVLMHRIPSELCS